VIHMPAAGCGGEGVLLIPTKGAKETIQRGGWKRASRKTAVELWKVSQKYLF